MKPNPQQPIVDGVIFVILLCFIANFDVEITIFSTNLNKYKCGPGQGRSHPPASLGTSPGSTSTFFVASSTITRTSRFSCGFTCGYWCKFRRKHIFYGFCQRFRFPGKCNTFVGNCFLRILGSAGNVQLSA